MFGAACSGRTLEMFPRYYDGPKAAAAFAICAKCSAVEACANAAIERRETYGIWGGLTPERIAAIADDRERMVRGC